MTLALLTDVLIIEVVHVLLAPGLPMRTVTVVAALAYSLAAIYTAMIEEFGPRCAIEIAFGTLVVAR
jgi:hypothetical protein